MAATGQLTFDWATAQIELLSDLRNQYALRYVYVEFYNVIDPDTIVAVPTIGRATAAMYYSGLATDACGDYLRIPISSFVKVSTDSVNFPGGNKLTVISVTDGLEGVHGKPFSHTGISKVIGGALVVAPEPGDPTRDIVYDRFYYPTVSHAIKPEGQQLTISRSLIFN